MSVDFAKRIQELEQQVVEATKEYKELEHEFNIQGAEYLKVIVEHNELLSKHNKIKGKQADTLIIDELEPINAKLVAVDHDVINKPSHYQFEIEVYDIIEILLKGNPNYKEVDAYNIGNVIKYLFRAGLKGEFYEDIGKAEWYLKAIKEKENENK